MCRTLSKRNSSLPKLSERTSDTEVVEPKLKSLSLSKLLSYSLLPKSPVENEYVKSTVGYGVGIEHASQVFRQAELSNSSLQNSGTDSTRFMHKGVPISSSQYPATAVGKGVCSTDPE